MVSNEWLLPIIRRWWSGLAAVMPLSPQSNITSPRKRKEPLWVPPPQMRKRRRKCCVQHGEDAAKQPTRPLRTLSNQHKVRRLQVTPACSCTSLQQITLQQTTNNTHKSNNTELPHIMVQLPFDCARRAYRLAAAITLLHLISGAASGLGVDHSRHWSTVDPCMPGDALLFRFK